MQGFEEIISNQASHWLWQS